MSKQTKQIMAVAAGVLALVGLQSVTVPTRPATGQSVSYSSASSADDNAYDGQVERTRKRVHRYTNRFERDPSRNRDTRTPHTTKP